MSDIDWREFFNKLICIKQMVNSNNIDWTLVVAIASLFFALLVGVATIVLTKKTIKISNDSLMAAKKSIDISIDLYEKQKNDLKETEENIRQTNFLGMEIINGLFIQEAMTFISRFMSVLNMNAINEKVISFDIKERNLQFFFVFKDITDTEIDAMNVWLINSSSFYSYVFEASRIDGKCLHDLKVIYDIYNEVERLFHVFLFLIEEDYYRNYSNLDCKDIKRSLTFFNNELIDIKNSLKVNDIDSYNG